MNSGAKLAVEDDGDGADMRIVCGRHRDGSGGGRVGPEGVVGDYLQYPQAIIKEPRRDRRVDGAPHPEHCHVARRPVKRRGGGALNVDGDGIGRVGDVNSLDAAFKHAHGQGVHGTSYVHRRN